MDRVVPINEVAGSVFWRLKHYFHDNKGRDINAGISAFLEPASGEFWNAIYNSAKQSENNYLLGAPEYNGVLLPRGAKFVFRRGHKTVFVIEQPPQVRNVSFQRELVSAHRSMKFFGAGRWPCIKTTFQLATPYVIFIFKFDDSQKKEINSERVMWSYFSDTPLTSLKHLLYDNFLPNNNYGRICLPYLEAKYRRQKTYAGIIETSIEHYWRSAFTIHETEMLNFYQIMRGAKGLESLWEWERRTKENPDFILNVRGGAPVTLKQVVDELFSDVENSTAETIANIFVFEYNRERRRQLDKVAEYLSSLDLSADLQAQLAGELKTIAMEWEKALLTIIKKGDKKNHRGRLVKRVQGFFDEILGCAPTTKGGGK